MFIKIFGGIIIIAYKLIIAIIVIWGIYWLFKALLTQIIKIFYQKSKINSDKNVKAEKNEDNNK